MKAKFLFFLIVFYSLNLVAQNRDNTWILGNQVSGNNLGLDFSNNELDTFTLFHNMIFLITNGSICDTAGNILFYTNGTYIANKNNDTLYNSKSFNTGYLTDSYYQGFWLGVSQGVIVIPEPDNNNRYYLFSVSGEKIETDPFMEVQPTELRYSIINMDLDNGLGGIEADQKKLSIVTDTLCLGRITACKHANGRDWWVITRKHLSNNYYKLLISPDSISVTEQEIGFTFNKNDAIGMAVFSPQGDYYAHLNNDDTLQIMKFDRCSGEFSDPILIPVLDTVWTLGCAFSPSGRFLYVSSYLHIFQVDLWSSDILNSVKEVATYEEVAGSPRWFSLMQLAPDNKIYISTYGGSTYLHKIDTPDSLGLVCNVVQSANVLPSYNSLSLPNFPNYDLGILNGSLCDSLYLNSTAQIITKSIFYISPNPTSDWIDIVYQSDKDCLFELYNLHGKRVATLSLYHYFKNRLLDVTSFPSGIYLARVIENGRSIWDEKVVITR